MQPFDVLSPILFAVFIWWFSTGIIMVAFNRPRWVVRLFFGGMTLVLVVAMMSVVTTRADASIEAIYVAMACGVTIWGWQVAGYYLDFITGPIKPMKLKQRSLWERFWLALNASIHHEVLAAIFAVVLAGIVWASPNKWALWTYLTLWIMHSSSKLTIFFGVRNFHIEFLPNHMQPLGQLLDRRPHNLFFFITTLVATSAVFTLIYQAIVPPVDQAQVTGIFLIVTLMVLGIIEHIVLVVPLPATIWGWGLRALPEPVPAKNTHMMKGPSQ